MYKIVVRNKEGKITFIGNTYDMFHNLKFEGINITSDISDINIFKSIKIGYSVEFFNQLRNDFTYFDRKVIEVTSKSIMFEASKNEKFNYRNDEALELLNKYKLEYRLSKLNKLV